jgi:hypothetical protein
MVMRNTTTEEDEEILDTKIALANEDGLERKRPLSLLSFFLFLFLSF